MKFRNLLVAALFICLKFNFTFAQGIDCSNVDDWQPGSAYNTGDQVVRYNTLYQTKWWDVGSKPEKNNGDWNVWTKLGACDNFSAKLEYVNPQNLAILDVSNDKEVELEINVNNALNIHSLNVFILGSKYKLNQNGSVWTGIWVPKKNGIYELDAEATDASGKLYTTKITVEVIGIVEEEILITYFFPINGGVYEPGRALYFQVEVYDRNIAPTDVISVHFEIDTTIKEAVYEPQLNRWVANVVIPSTPGNYSVKTVAKDNSGNKAIKEIQIVAKEKPTNKLPVAVFNQPHEGDLLNLKQNTLFPINFKAWDPDGAVLSVALYINNQLQEDFSISGDSLYEWNWEPSATGDYELAVLVVDNLGATSRVAINVSVVSPGDCYFPWNPFRIYYRGEHVSYNGYNYQAKWWTYSENPELYSKTWDTWTKLEMCEKLVGHEVKVYDKNVVRDQLDNVSLYPNPATDKINFSGLDFDAVKIEIKDIVGNLVFRKVLEKNEHTIFINKLPAGSYLATFKVGLESTNKLFIKK